MFDELILPAWYGYTLCVLFGLVIGSFLNVLVARVPDRETLLTRSRCPKCRTEIRARDNIPIVSWLLLRGRCHMCRNSISWQYPAVEAGTAVAFVVTAWAGFHYIPEFTVFAAVPLLGFVAVLITLALIDAQTLLLPDPLTAAAALFAVGVVVVSATTAPDSLQVVITALVSAVAFAIFYFCLWFGTGGRGLGFGDVKLAPSLGAVLGVFGYGSALVGFVAAFIIAGVPFAIMLAFKLVKRRSQVPFGPFLIAGTGVGIVFGVPIAALYLSISGL
jgi:leader peptidase (prepilin peptidase)/N-methyltransferase